MSLLAFQRLLAPISGPLLAPMYRLVLARKNAAFDAGKGVITLDRPVISVGNLSTGGTGKTPTVAAIVSLLLEHGHAPAIAMRGFGAPSGQGHLSDEAREYRQLFADVPLVAQPNRVDGLLMLFAQEAQTKEDGPKEEGPKEDGRQEAGEEESTREQHVDGARTQRKPTSVVVLDDGFQHRKLARQLDIVLLDVTRNPFTDALLPAGMLREPVESLRRAHIVMLTRSDAVSLPEQTSLREQVRTVAPQAHVCLSRHAWDGFDLVLQGTRAASSWVQGKRVFAACAIGNPQAFVRQVGSAAGANVPAERIMTLADHDPYAAPTIAELLARLKSTRAECLVVTRKDWVKLQRVKPEAWPCEVAVPRLTMQISDAPGQRETWQQLVLAAAKMQVED